MRFLLGKSVKLGTKKYVNDDYQLAIPKNCQGLG